MTTDSKWLSNAAKSVVGWFKPTTFEVLKGQKQLQDTDVQPKQVFLTIPQMVEVDSNIKLKFKTIPHFATYDGYTVTSSDENICSYDADTDTLHFKDVGSVDVSILIDDVSTSKTITVERSAVKVEIVGGDTVEYGKTNSLTFKLLPEDTTEIITKVEAWDKQNVIVSPGPDGVYEVTGRFDRRIERPLRVYTNKQELRTTIKFIDSVEEIVQTIDVEFEDKYNFNTEIFIRPIFGPDTANMKSFDVVLDDYDKAEYVSGRGSIITKEVNGVLNGTITMLNGGVSKDFNVVIDDEFVVLKDVELVGIPVDGVLSMNQVYKITDIKPIPSGLGSVDDFVVSVGGDLEYVDGEIVGYTEGSGSITITSESREFTKVIPITVVDKGVEVELQELKLVKQSSQYYTNEISTIEVVVTPSNYKIPDDFVPVSNGLTFTKTGPSTFSFTATKIGNASITASIDGVSDTISINLLSKLASVELKVADTEFTVGGVHNYTLTVTPADADVSDLVINSTNATINTANKTITVNTVTSAQRTIITATSAKYGKTSNITVPTFAVFKSATITPAVSSMVLGATSTIAINPTPQYSKFPTDFAIVGSAGIEVSGIVYNANRTSITSAKLKSIADGAQSITLQSQVASLSIVNAITVTDPAKLVSLAITGPSTIVANGAKSVITVSPTPNTATLTDLDFVVTGDLKVDKATKQIYCDVFTTGTGTIKATSQGKQSNVITVTITRPVATSLVITGLPASVNVNGTATFNYTSLPANSVVPSDLTVTANNMLEVVTNKSVKGKAVGQGVITFTSVSAGINQTSNITVNADPLIVTAVNNNAPATMIVGSSVVVNTTVLPATASASKVVYTVEGNVAYNAATKTLTATAIGSGKLIGTADGVVKTVNITVTADPLVVTAINNNAPTTMTVGDSAVITTTVLPATASVSKVAYTVEGGVTYDVVTNTLTAVTAGNGKLIGTADGITNTVDIVIADIPEPEEPVV